MVFEQQNQLLLDQFKCTSYFLYVLLCLVSFRTHGLYIDFLKINAKPLGI